VLVAVVVERHDLALEQVVELVGVGGVALRLVVVAALAADRPAVHAVEPLGPPAVEDGEVEDAVHRGLLTGGAGGLQRTARVVQPHVDAARERPTDRHVVVLEEQDAAVEAGVVGQRVDLRIRSWPPWSAGWALPANTSWTGRSGSVRMRSSRSRSRSTSVARL
jgi:hypothetical protein